jgi:PleD family two-component response regulator
MEKINILLVKHGPKDQKFLVSNLSEDAYQLMSANKRREVLGLLAKEEIHIILINVPSLSREVHEMCKEIRKHAYNKPLQIVFTTSIKDQELYSKIIDLGADDFVKKPLKPQEIQARVKAAILRLKKQSSLFDEREYFKNAVFQEEQLSSKILDQNIFLKKAFQTVAKENKELKKVKKELEKIAMFDTLSGLLNRLSLFNRIDIEIERSSRAMLPLAGIMLDIDHFKEINDNFGHQCGDQVIKEIGERLRNTTLEQAATIGERFRREIAKSKFICNDEEIAITVSMGISQYRSTEQRDKWIERADKAMYIAKQTGRNRVCTESR